MDTYLRFLYEFLMQFFSGIQLIFKGFISGITAMFNIKSYISILNFYKSDFKGSEWIFVVIAIVLLLLLLSLFILIIVFLIRKYIRFRKTLVEEEELLEEVANLNDEVSKFLEGFKLMYKQIKELLNKFEVKEIECLGKEFDPTYHQAVVMDKDETKESGIVTEVLQKGYMYKDRVLRTAMVKVNE